MSKWILRDELSGSYFKQWTGIGPMSTQDISEAHQFDSREEALRSPAFAFGYAFFEPMELTERSRSPGPSPSSVLPKRE